MSPLDLLSTLESRGLSVRGDGERLIIGPAFLLDDRLRDLVREHRNELIHLISKKRDLGWTRLRELGAQLGNEVEAGGRRYQLWGLTPRGAILFDGKVLRTLALEYVRPP